MYRQQNPLGNLKFFLRQRNMLSRLVLINIAAFIVVSILGLFLWLFELNSSASQQAEMSPFVEWFAIPSNPASLFKKPWTIFTYMFLHEGFFHLLLNMIMLYFGGRIFLEYMNDRKLLGTYLWGGIFGGLLYVISYNYFPVFNQAVGYSVALGASASVLAILVAIATHVPNYYVNLILLGRVRLKHLAIAFIVIDLLSIQGSNPGGHIAHIGGALWGFLYIQLLKKGWNFSNLFSFPTFSFKKGPRKSYSNPGYKRPESDDTYNRNRVSTQKDIDKILEKISKSGYSSLTKKEKELLFKNSNKE